MNILRNHARACAVILAALATSVNAASVSVSGPATVLPGDAFQITLQGDFSGVGLFGGDVLLNWNDSLVDLTSVTLETGTTDVAFSCPGTAPYCSGIDDTAFVVGWGPSGSVVLDGTEPAPTLMATLNFTALPGPGGLADFSLAPFLGGFGGILDASGNDITFSTELNGASVQIGVSASPVPAAVWLFGSGLLGLVGVARRKAKAA